MFITIKERKTEKILFKDLKEAEMDESCQLLSENPNGLCVVGLSSCSAVIIQYENETILAHISSLWVQMDQIKCLVESLLSKNQDFRITIARCLNSFNEENKREAQATNEEYQCQNAKQLFGESDQDFRSFFKETFNITPEFLMIEHDCLTVRPDNAIETFNRYPFQESEDTVKWIEQKEYCPNMQNMNKYRPGFFQYNEDDSEENLYALLEAGKNTNSKSGRILSSTAYGYCNCLW